MPLYDDMFGQRAGPSAQVRCRSHSVVVWLVRHHPHRQFFCEIPTSASPFPSSRAPEPEPRACTAFTSATEKWESELSIGPPFCCPNTFQTDWIVTTIVDVLSQVLGTVVPAEGIGVFEGSPHAAHQAATSHGLESCPGPHALT